MITNNMVQLVETIEVATSEMETNTAITLLVGVAVKIALESVDEHQRQDLREDFLRVAGELFDIGVIAADNDDEPS